MEVVRKLREIEIDLLRYPLKRIIDGNYAQHFRILHLRIVHRSTSRGTALLTRTSTCHDKCEFDERNTTF